MPDFSPSKWLQSNNHLFYLSHPSPVLFVAVSQRPSYPHLSLPPPSLITSSFNLISPPYTSTHHPSSSLFCCYIIATITITSTMLSLTPSLQIVLPAPSHLLPCFSHPSPILFVAVPQRPSYLHLSPSFLLLSILPHISSHPLTPPHATPLLLYFVAIS